MKYSPERREAILTKLMAPHNRTVAELAQEEGISEATLYNWRKQARDQGRLLPNQASTPEGWSSAEKFNAVLETAALSETELAEYCRRGGAAVVNKPMTSVPKHPHSKQKSLKQNVNASRNWSVNCVVKMPPWLKRRPSWPCEKKSRRSGGTRKNDQCHRSPPNC